MPWIADFKSLSFLEEKSPFLSVMQSSGEFDGFAVFGIKSTSLAVNGAGGYCYIRLVEFATPQFAYRTEYFLVNLSTFYFRN